VSGDGQDGVREQVNEFIDSVGRGYYFVDPDDGSFTPIKWAGSPVAEQYKEELLSLIDAQYNAGLEAAEGASYQRGYAAATKSWLNAYMQSTGIESDPFIEAMKMDLGE
jgi:hypothetical protein